MSTRPKLTLIVNPNPRLLLSRSALIRVIFHHRWIARKRSQQARTALFLCLRVEGMSDALEFMTVEHQRLAEIEYKIARDALLDLLTLDP